MKKIKDVREYIDSARQGIGEAYDDLESISAKVKMWINVNKVRLVIDAGIAFVFLMIGLIL